MNKQSFVIYFFISGLFCEFFSSCTHDTLTPLADAPVMSFKDDVQPVIISNCTQSGCHGKGGGEFSLVTFNDIAGSVSGGSPHKSKLYKVITANAIGTMPPSPNRRLTDVEIKIIYLWIAQGANDN